MTNPGTRAEISAYLYLLWTQHPELRFCQLMQFIMGSGDLFYVDDEVLLAKAKEKYEQGLVVKKSNDD